MIRARIWNGARPLSCRKPAAACGGVGAKGGGTASAATTAATSARPSPPPAKVGGGVARGAGGGSAGGAGGGSAGGAGGGSAPPPLAAAAAVGASAAATDVAGASGGATPPSPGGTSPSAGGSSPSGGGSTPSGGGSSAAASPPFLPIKRVEYPYPLPLSTSPEELSRSYAEMQRRLAPTLAEHKARGGQIAQREALQLWDYAYSYYAEGGMGGDATPNGDDDARRFERATAAYAEHVEWRFGSPPGLQAVVDGVVRGNSPPSFFSLFCSFFLTASYEERRLTPPSHRNPTPTPPQPQPVTAAASAHSPT